MDCIFRISDLVKTYRCPVRFFLEKDEPAEESLRFTICKQLSYHLGDSPDPDAIWAEISAVRPGADAGMQEFLQECIGACLKNTEWRRPVQTDVAVRSDRYGMAGRIDKIYDDPVTFSLVRCSTPPPAGVYPADRLRVAACILCLKETSGRDFDGGCIEYIPAGIVRYVRPQPRDRRALMTAIRDAGRILGGETPPKPVESSRCVHCRHAERCLAGSGAKRLSSLF